MPNPQDGLQAMEKFVVGLGLIQCLAGGLALLVCLLAAGGEPEQRRLAWLLFGPALPMLPLGIGLLRQQRWVLWAQRVYVPLVLVGVPLLFALQTDLMSMSPAIAVGAIMAFAVGMLFQRPEVERLLAD
jgi:multisubunit Na+/H+ antiporter MnhB subunit